MTNKTSIIAAIEKEQMGKEIPDFSPGDTVVVQVKVKEGELPIGKLNGKGRVGSETTSP